MAMEIEDRIPLAQDILERWKAEIGRDYPGYRNHVYRVLHFCFALRDCDAEERQKVIIAACFHDLGIWSDHTADYLPPSTALAKDYLRQNQLEHWSSEVGLIIDTHHKLRTFRDSRYPLVEVLRKADLVDVSLGIVKFDLPRAYVRRVKQQFPNAGFHKRLVRLVGGWSAKHPLSPPPFFRW